MDEGYIKFECNLVDGQIDSKKILELNLVRKKLYDLGLIGMYQNGIGFGNISTRSENGFIITASATGGKENLTTTDYTLVTDFSFEKNSLTCKGKINASSESLTHAAVYQASPKTNAVIHIHNLELWEKLLDIIPTTKDVAYGTPKMANEVIRLFNETKVNEEKIFVMKGHKEGIVAFGESLNDALNTILNYLKK